MKKFFSLLLPIITIVLIVGGTYFYMHSGSEKIKNEHSKYVSLINDDHDFGAGLKGLESLTTEKAKSVLSNVENEIETATELKSIDESLKNADIESAENHLDKAKQLGLLGEKFDEYVKDNAPDFASHFLYTYMENPNLITNYTYNYTDYVKEINDAQNEQHNKYDEDEIKKLRRLSNVYQYIESLGIDITKLREDTDNTVNDKYANVRKDDEATWINASIGYLSKVTSDGETVQKILRMKYGNVVTKYNKRRFRCHK